MRHRFTAPSSQRPKMLIVDDQPINIRILYELFRIDFDVYMAGSGEEALEKCASLLPDLVLLDVVMPGMDGFEVCRQLKSTPSLAAIPVIFITANYDEKEEVKGFLVGAADFIHKPVNAVITRARINNQLLLKRQADTLRTMALQDGLTGIANRRLFEESLNAALLQAMRDQTPLAIALIDVDFFKQYNDHYGHQSGDECLRRIAGALDGVLARPYDLMARYGGEEFVALAPGADGPGILLLAQAMVERVRELQLEHVRSSIGGVVTISAGAVSTIPKRGETYAQELLQAADEQLYLAKSSGRARVCIGTL